MGSNAILAAMPDSVLNALKPHLKLIELRRGGKVDHQTIMFPRSGLIGIETAAGESAVITAIIGRSGVVNALSAFKCPPFGEGIVLAAGSGFSLSPEVFEAALAEDPALTSSVMGFQSRLLGEVQQSAACNAIHDIASRVCRWILLIREEVGDLIPLKQTDIAGMLGVQRTSISSFATTLQSEGIIKVRRGVIEIVAPDALRAMACECLGERAPVHTHPELRRVESPPRQPSL